MSRAMTRMMVVGLVLIVSGSAWSDTIFVKAGSSGDGSSWANAYGDLQDGLDDADPNDEIWVAAGTYKPTSDYGLDIGDRGKHFRMKNGVSIYGGFPATGDPGWLDRDLETCETTLSGDLHGNDEPVADPRDLFDDPNRAENCYHVFYHPVGTDLDPNAVLDSFTVTGGYANDLDDHKDGGGMCNIESNPTVTNCIFRDSLASYGGGMYNDEYSSPMVTYCTFKGNFAYYGAGMINRIHSNPTVVHCVFLGNDATIGGGMRNYNHSNPTVSHCTFSGNEATDNGGGMYNYYSNPNIMNCLFSGNSTLSLGGGFYNNNCNPTLTNCTFSGNAAKFGGGIFNADSIPTITNCILWGNTAPDGPQIYNFFGSAATVTYSDIQGGYPGTGNIDADPIFKDADGPDDIVGTEDDNLQPAYNSPCIDAGNNTAVPPDSTDLDSDGNTIERIPFDLDSIARFLNDPETTDTGQDDPPDYLNIVDMGAYEFSLVYLGDTDFDFDVDIGDLANIHGQWTKTCKGPFWCNHCDINRDGHVSLMDFAIFSCNWLTGYSGN